MTPPPGYLTPVWSPRGAGHSRPSACASLPSSPLSRSAPQPPPCARLAIRHRRRARGAGRQPLSPLQSRPLATAAAPLRLAARSAPHSGSRDAGPERPADRRASVEARLVARSMDSDSGEQSEGEPVTTAGTEGSRHRSQEGWGRQEGRPGLEIASISLSGQAGGRSPAARSLPSRDWGLLRAVSLLWAFSPIALGRAGGRGGAFAGDFPRCQTLAAGSGRPG